MSNMAQRETKKDKFLEELVSLKEQIRSSSEKRFIVPKGIENVVIAGMGGSGIVGRIFQEMYSELPVSLVNGYNIPKFVDKNTLFIAVSYSGNTEETLSAFSQAKKQGAHLIAITSGGTLAKEAGQKTVIVPGGISPRSALGYMLMPLLNSFGVVSREDINETYEALATIDNQNSKERAIAEEIFEKKHIPVIYSTSPYDSLAYRWNTQFNENAKLMALWSSFPELNHNNTMALRGTYRKDELYFICIKASDDSRIEKRVRSTQEVADFTFGRVIEAKGRSELAKVMSLVHIGDYITYHLANLIGVNPLDISPIEELKIKLRDNP